MICIDMTWDFLCHYYVLTKCVTLCDNYLTIRLLVNKTNKYDLRFSVSLVCVHQLCHPSILCQLAIPYSLIKQSKCVTLMSSTPMRTQVWHRKFEPTILYKVYYLIYKFDIYLVYIIFGIIIIWPLACVKV